MDGSLSALARSCVEALEDLVQENRDVVHVEQSSPVEYEHSNLIDDCLGRFKVWARNLGAFQNPESQSSLDYRLHDGEEMRDAVKEQLEGLLESSLRGAFLWIALSL